MRDKKKRQGVSWDVKGTWSSERRLLIPFGYCSLAIGIIERLAKLSNGHRGELTLARLESTPDLVDPSYNTAMAISHVGPYQVQD